jgi:hypothetical protein
MGVKAADKRPGPRHTKRPSTLRHLASHLFVSALLPVTELPTRGGGRGFNPFRIARPPLGAQTFGPSQKLPTKLAQLSVIGARIALGRFASLDEVIGASLVGGGIGDADTGIVGVCLCWWDAEGRQCYGCCRRHAH